MKIQNSIGWCDETINAVTGCDKVSPGCKNCYAEIGTRARVLRAQGRETWGPKGERVAVIGFAGTIHRLNKICICDTCRVIAGFQMIGQPCIYVGPNREGKCQGTFRRIRLFADSNSDWLDPKWPPQTLGMFLRQVLSAENLDIQLLTKRPENWRSRLIEAKGALTKEKDYATCDRIDWWLSPVGSQGTPRHLWIGVSVEDRPRLDRLEALARIPAAVRFASFEPLLEDLGLTAHEARGLDWAIVGGESGDKRRDCGLDAIMQTTGALREAGVRTYVKQDCAFKPGQQGRIQDYIWALKQFPAPREDGQNRRRILTSPADLTDKLE